MTKGEPRNHSNECNKWDWVGRDHFNVPHYYAGDCLIAFIHRSPVVFQLSAEKLWVRIT